MWTALELCIGMRKSFSVFYVRVPSPAATEEHSQAERVAFRGSLPRIRNDSAFAPFAGTTDLAAGTPQWDGSGTLPESGEQHEAPHG